jgi:tetratricopeptide (TPR) repeat protein
MLGRCSEALKHLAEAASLAEATKLPRLAATAARYRARALLADGEAEKSIAEAESMLSKIEGAHLVPQQIDLLATSARAHLSQGRIAAAELASRQAIELLERAGGIDEGEADVYLTRAETLSAAGRSEEARAILQRGKARLRSVAQGIADEEWRALFLERVSSNRRLLGS